LELFILSHSFGDFGQWLLGPITLSLDITSWQEHMAKEAAHFMAAGKQKERT
jgi:hypothetical protein